MKAEDYGGYLKSMSSAACFPIVWFTRPERRRGDASPVGGTTTLPSAATECSVIHDMQAAAEGRKVKPRPEGYAPRPQ
jgi:hypothetical protein